MRYRGMPESTHRGMNRGHGASANRSGKAVRKTPAELQSECDRWNDAHPIGTRVTYYRRIRPREEPEGEYITRSQAQVLGDHSAVLWLQGKSGCVDLESCVPVEAQR